MAKATLQGSVYGAGKDAGAHAGLFGPGNSTENFIILQNAGLPESAGITA